MRIALDATPLRLSSGGLKRYTEQLSLALAEQFPQDVFSFVSDQPFELPAAAPSNLRKGPHPRGWLEKRWWLLDVSRAMRAIDAELFHGVNFEVPYLNQRPSVVTVHDLSPWKETAWHVGAGRVRSRAPWLLRSGIATMVITPSEAIRRECIQYFGLQPERVVATPLGAARISPPEPVVLPARPYFLFAGTIEPRKNVEALVDAWRAIRADCPVDLVLAGRVREDGPQLPDEPGLVRTGEVSDGQLAALYRDALALVYPSHYEGFGLPVLEAMQCGTAVAVSRDPALGEVAGDGALRFDSVRELASVLRALYGRPELLGAQRARSLARAASFSWQRTAGATREVYGEALARFG